jgi:hypothetical protein
MDQLIAIAAVGCLAMMGVMVGMTLRINRSTSTTERDECRLLLAEIDKLNLEPESKANDRAVFGNRHGGKMVVDRTLSADEPWPPRLM